MLKRRFSLILRADAAGDRAAAVPDLRQSIWFDEGWSAYAASQPTLDVTELQVKLDPNINPARFREICLELVGKM